MTGAMRRWTDEMEEGESGSSRDVKGWGGKAYGQAKERPWTAIRRRAAAACEHSHGMPIRMLSHALGDKSEVGDAASRV